MAGGLGIDVQERGVDRAKRNLEEMGLRAKDVRGVSFKVRTVFRKAEERRFNSQGDGSWPPLAQATREAKARNGQDPRMLRATGALFRSLTSPRAAGQIDERRPDEFRFGTKLPYAQFHDTGRGVPKRKLIDLTVKERREIDDAISAFIARNETH